MATRTELVRELQDRFAPVTLAREQLLPVPEPLAPLFPFGGLQKGQSVGFRGTGGWSVALSLAGAITGADGWLAVIGAEDLGLVAAAELGVPLDRLLVIESVAPSLLATVVAALVDSIDVILLTGREPVGRRDARRLTARSRERGAVLFHLDGGRSWPEAHDLTISAASGGWEGIGAGHGHLRVRRLDIEAVGRRSSARRRRATVLLPGPDGTIATPAEKPRPLLTTTSNEGTLARVS